MPEAALALDRERLTRVRDGAVIVTTEPAVFRIEGTGALTCLQGLLTNDLEKPGNASMVYGALLTPKGMIVADYWVLRHAGAFTLVTAPQAREPSLELFRRSLPPRLAQVTDQTGAIQVAWLLGTHAFQTLAQAGVRVPEASGRVVDSGPEDGLVALALAPESAPFVALAVGDAAAVACFAGRLTAAGARAGDESDLDAARILSGWPGLGAEIDERTLPQEVRYDEIGGVSYTKGCYTGQETVARLHFRGHTNRCLKGLRWDGTAALDGRTVLTVERDVGSVRSTLVLDDRILGLALLRREVQAGETVVAGGRQAVVTPLPFSVDDVDG